MKNIKALCFCLLIVTFLYNKLIAQSWMQALNGDLDSLNYFQVQKDFYNYWKEHESELKIEYNEDETEEQVETGGLYGRFKDWERFWEKRINGDGSFPKSGYLIEERKKYLTKQREKSNDSNYSASWTPFLNNYDFNIQSVGNGRIDCIAINPVDSNIIWAGSPTGGLWKSTDGGHHWTTNTDTLAVLGISDIIIDPQNPSIMYIATGDRDSQRIHSIGVLKSIDGGNSWQETGLNSSLTLFYLSNTNIIRKLIINPQNTNILYAATKQGIWKTTDGGNNWTQQFSIEFKDIILQPNNPSTVYAVSSFSYNGIKIYKSTDNGISYNIVTTGLPQDNNLYFTRLAVTVADPNYLYLLVATNDFKGLYISTDAGNTFNLQSNSPNILHISCVNPPPGYGQGYYDLALCVSPTNKNLVFVGGIQIWKSSDAGVTWSISHCGPGVHPDIHYLTFSPHNPNKIFTGNDGGIGVSNNSGLSWADIPTNLQNTQYYTVGSSATNNFKVIAGSQDNGTHLYQNTNQSAGVFPGDGFRCMIDYTNEDILYGSNTSGIFKKIIGVSMHNISPVINRYSYLTIHPTNPAVLFSYYNYFYKSLDRGENWFQISDSINNYGWNIKFSGTDTTNIYIKSPSWRLTKFNTITGVKTIISPDMLLVNDFVVSPTDTNKIWVVLSGSNTGENVFQTIDGGNNWTNISGSLPDISFTGIVYEIGSNDGLYICSDIGVFYKNTDMSDWIPWMDGLPNVIVNELDIQYGAGKLRAATYGRGVWEANLYPLTPTANFIATTQSICQQDSIAFTDLSDHYPSSWQWSFPGGTPATSTLENPTVLYTTSGNYDVQLIVTNQANSDTINLENYITVNNCTVGINDYPKPVINVYPNPSNGVFTVSIKSNIKDILDIKVFDMVGQIVYKNSNGKIAGNYETTLNLEHLSTGIYILKIKLGNELINTRLILNK